MPSSRRDVNDRLSQLIQVFIAGAVLNNERIARLAGINVVDLQTFGVIYRSPEPMTPGEVSAATYLPTSTTTRVLDRLEQHGFVRREPHPHDRRRIQVRAVGESLAGIAGQYAVLLEQLERHNRGFTVAELEVVIRYLQGMNEIDEVPGATTPPPTA